MRSIEECYSATIIHVLWSADVKILTLFRFNIFLCILHDFEEADENEGTFEEEVDFKNSVVLLVGLY